MYVKVIMILFVVFLSDLHAFSPVKPNDQVGTAFEGVRVSCNTPAYKPGESNNKQTKNENKN